MGVCKNTPEHFKVTHIVKEASESIRLNLAFTDWPEVKGLSFVNYDTLTKKLSFSSKCHEEVVNLTKAPLLAWAKEIQQGYYTN